jgi:hypothetical protein
MKKNVFIGVLILVLLSVAIGLIFLRSDPHKEDFTNTFSVFQEQQYNCWMDTNILVFDMSKALEKETFLSMVQKVFDSTINSQTRLELVSEAMEISETDHKSFVTWLETDIEELDTITQTLLSTAPLIKNEDLKKIAVEISENSREVFHNYEELRGLIAQRNAIVLNMYESIKDDEGHLNYYNYNYLNELEEGNELKTQITEMMDQNDMLIKEIEDKYYAIEGRLIE